MGDSPKDAGGWMVIDKRNHREYFYNIEKKDYETKSGNRTSLNKDIEQQLGLTLNKIGKKMNYQFKLF